MCGNEALAEAAIMAGCDAYFGYPITPQNEVPAYMSRRMAEEGRVAGFLEYGMSAHGEIGTVDLQLEAGGDDSLVLLPHGLGQSSQVGGVGRVIAIGVEDCDQARRGSIGNCRTERHFDEPRMHSPVLVPQIGFADRLGPRALT